MASVLLWIGIVLTVIGWIALAWQASKRIVMQNELDKFPEKKNITQLQRNYCRLTIIIGVILILIAVIM